MMHLKPGCRSKKYVILLECYLFEKYFEVWQFDFVVVFSRSFLLFLFR